MGKLRRFLMLERARRAGPDDAAPAQRVADRFDGVRSPAIAPPPAAADPFAPPPESTDAVDASAPDDERPSTRCVGCGFENGRFAASCSACNASLRTAAVVRANRRLWLDERAQVIAQRRERRASDVAEVDAMAEERRKTAAVDAAFSRFVEGQRGRRASDIWGSRSSRVIGAILTAVVVAVYLWVKYLFGWGWLR